MFFSIVLRKPHGHGLGSTSSRMSPTRVHGQAKAGAGKGRHAKVGWSFLLAHLRNGRLSRGPDSFLGYL